MSPRPRSGSLSSFVLAGVAAAVSLAGPAGGCGGKGGTGSGGAGSGGGAAGETAAGGAAGETAAGTGGSAGAVGGAGGRAGSPTTDAGPDVGAGGRGCGILPPSRTYTRQKLFNITTGEGRAFPIPRGTPVPMAVYKGISTTNANRIVASTMPLIEADGGITTTTYNATPIAQVETFSPADLRFTGAGTPRLTYLASTATGYKIRYVEWTGDIAQPPTDGVVGTDSSFTSATSVPAIALDGSDRAFVAYYANDSSLRVASRSGTTWTVETVASNVFAASSEFALAVDAGGQPYLFLTGMGSFGDGGIAAGALTVFTKGASGWASKTLHTDSADRAPRAARSPSGEVQVLFAATDGLARAVLRGGAWQVDAPLGSPAVGFDATSTIDVAIGPGDIVHVVAGDRSQVIHFAYNDCQWLREVVDPGTAATSGYGIALDAAGNAHIAYQKSATATTGPTHEIWYATPEP
jgi:hypothetical protein